MLQTLSQGTYLNQLQFYRGAHRDKERLRFRFNHRPHPRSYSNTADHSGRPLWSARTCLALGVLSARCIIGCSSAGKSLSMNSLKESVTLVNNFVRSLCRKWLLSRSSDFFSLDIFQLYLHTILRLSTILRSPRARTSV